MCEKYAAALEAFVEALGYDASRIEEASETVSVAEMDSGELTGRVAITLPRVILAAPPVAEHV
jgi:hypothetical protein